MRSKEPGRGSGKYKEWREKVLKRDGYKCILCDSEKYLHCDHVIPWKENQELRFDISNGQTLCAGCHLKKGKQSKEIDGEKTQFKKGECKYPKANIGKAPWNKGKKTGLVPWNKGKKGVMPVPWNKGKELSEETKKKISESKKGQLPWMKGKKHSEEAKKKNREAHLGKRNSIETEFKKGMIPWNKKV